MKVEFLPGISHISGSLKSHMGNLVFKHRSGDKPGEGHMYLVKKGAYKRKTPLSEAELAAKRLFSIRAAYVKQLRSFNPQLSYREAWAIAKADIPSADRPPEYIFLHGRPLYDAKNNHVPLVQVDIPDRPEGTHPVCTRANAEKYGLTIYKDL